MLIHSFHICGLIREAEKNQIGSDRFFVFKYLITKKSFHTMVKSDMLGSDSWVQSPTPLLSPCATLST